MTAWLKISLILAAVILVFGAGFYTAKKFDLANDANELQAQIAARIEAEQKAGAAAASFENQKTKNDALIAQLLTKVRQAHAKNPITANCIVPGDRLQQIRAAASGGNAR